MLRPRILAALLVLLAPACGLIGAGDSDGDGENTDDNATLVPTTGTRTCDGDDDCPAPAPCERVACDDGRCVTTPRPAGDVVDEELGDCQNLVCDGDGAATPQSEPADIPDDGVACTDDVCEPGGPVNIPRPAGSPCDAAFVCHDDLSCQPCPARDGCADTSPAEPNETQSQATTLAQLLDDQDPAYLCETLGAADDVDWFTFTAVDTTLGAVAPAVDPTPAAGTRTPARSPRPRRGSAYTPPGRPRTAPRRPAHTRPKTTRPRAAPSPPPPTARRS
jgi:hypothetical protein